MKSEAVDDTASLVDLQCICSAFRNKENWKKQILPQLPCHTSSSSVTRWECSLVGNRVRQHFNKTLAQNCNSFLDASNVGHPLMNGNMLLSSTDGNKAMVYFSSFFSHTGIVLHFLTHKITSVPLIIVFFFFLTPFSTVKLQKLNLYNDSNAS